MIRTGLVWLGAAFLLTLLVDGPVHLAPRAWAPGLRLATTHLLVVGWLTQLIFGVAYWMFPRRPSEGLGTVGLGWTGYVALNAGLAARLVGEPSGVGWLLVVAAVAQLVGGLALIALIWPRIRER